MPTKEDAANLTQEQIHYLHECGVAIDAAIADVKHLNVYWKDLNHIIEELNSARYALRAIFIWKNWKRCEGCDTYRYWDEYEKGQEICQGCIEEDVVSG